MNFNADVIIILLLLIRHDKCYKSNEKSWSCRRSGRKINVMLHKLVIYQDGIT